MLPGGEVQEAGNAIWVMSATPSPFANGVIRYDARNFHGPASERELDNCLAVLSTYDVPWRFRAWTHLGADALVPRLTSRGMIQGRTDHAMWMDLPGAVLADASQPANTSFDGIDVQPATDPSEYRAWTKIFTRASDISSQHAQLDEQVVAMPQWLSLVARANRRPVGCLTLAFEEDLAVVHNVGVLPSARRLGVDRRLLLAAHEEAAARGTRASSWRLRRDPASAPAWGTTSSLASRTCRRHPDELAGHRRDPPSNVTATQRGLDTARLPTQRDSLFRPQCRSLNNLRCRNLR
jgi:ribosomal protein S18 acetylase RimI-like enzyme